MADGTKMPYKLESSSLNYWIVLSVHDLLLPFGMKALIGKTVLKKWIEKEYSIFQWYWSMNILQCILDSQSFFYFYRFYLQDIQYSLYN